MLTQIIGNYWATLYDITIYLLKEYACSFTFRLLQKLFKLLIFNL